MAFSPKEIAFLRKKRYSPKQIMDMKICRQYNDLPLLDLAADGNGREVIPLENILSTHTHNGLTVERIRLPGGIFRRVLQNNTVIRLTNLSETKKRIR